VVLALRVMKVAIDQPSSSALNEVNARSPEAGLAANAGSDAMMASAREAFFSMRTPVD
jgi:hypothetical protein